MDLITKLCPEEKLILCCARTHMDMKTKSKVRSLLHHDMNWNYVMKIATRHKLKSLVFYQLNKICPDMVPAEIMGVLNEYLNNNAKKNLLMFGELLKIYKLLKSENITVLPYKGPVLAINEYGNLSLREFNDLDLFISFKDVINTKKLLINEGYISDIELGSLKEKEYIKTQRDLKFFKEEIGLTLEIHWTFHSLYLSLPHNQKLFNENNTIEIDIGETHFNSPSYEDMFLILCLHNASHRWMRLSWICDLNEFVNVHKLNWEKIIRKAKQMEIERILFINLYLTNHLFGLELPKEVHGIFEDRETVNLAEKITNDIFEGNSKNLIEEGWITIKLREKLFYGINDFLKGLFTPGVCEWKSLSLPIYLWVLYRIYRPFNLIKRYRVK